MASRKAVAFLLANPDIAKAYAEGKPIQFRSKSLKYGEEWTDWNITQELTFNEQFDYRLKPEPKSYYRVLNRKGEVYHHTFKKDEAERHLATANKEGMYGPYVLEEYKQVL